MNIFVLDLDPQKAARYHCDKHVNKMISETTQMLSTVHHKYGSTAAPWKLAYPNHPCTIWAGKSRANYDWLSTLGFELCCEFSNRYGHPHKCSQYLLWGELSSPLNGIPDGPLTPFAQAMPDEYKNPDPVIAYRDYYIGEKASFARWKNSPTPEWWPA